MQDTSINLLKDLTLLEKKNYQKILKLKSKSGSHSPSINNLREFIPSLKIDVDACFLSNPYATELFLRYFEEEIINQNKFRDLLEFYPSQMGVIANKLSSVLGVNSNQIFVANGAIEAIQAVMHRFVSKKVLINIPTFSSYYEFIKDDIEVIFNQLSPENNFKINVEEILKTIKENNIDSAVFINPNNPDGSYFTLAEITNLLEKLDELETVIIDESFVHFAYETDELKPVTVAKLISKFPNLIIIKSMSKDFGVAGIRAGYSIMNKDRVYELIKNGYLWNVSGLTEYFFDLYTRKDFLSEYEVVRKKYINETKKFLEEFKKIKGIRVYESKANFVLVELLNKMDSDEFVFKMLVKFGVYTRTCSDKIGLGNNFIRVASRSKKENKKILFAFQQMLNVYG